MSQHKPRLGVEVEPGAFEEVGRREEALTVGKSGDGCEPSGPSLRSPMLCGDGALMDRNAGSKLWL